MVESLAELVLCHPLKYPQQFSGCTMCETIKAAPAHLVRAAVHGVMDDAQRQVVDRHRCRDQARRMHALHASHSIDHLTSDGWWLSAPTRTDSTGQQRSKITELASHLPSSFWTVHIPLTSSTNCQNRTTGEERGWPRT